MVSYFPPSAHGGLAWLIIKTYSYYLYFPQIIARRTDVTILLFTNSTGYLDAHTKYITVNFTLFVFIDHKKLQIPFCVELIPLNHPQTLHSTYVSQNLLPTGVGLLTLVHSLQVSRI